MIKSVREYRLNQIKDDKRIKIFNGFIVPLHSISKERLKETVLVKREILYLGLYFYKWKLCQIYELNYNENFLLCM